MADSSNADKPSKPCKYSIHKKLSEGADKFSYSKVIEIYPHLARTTHTFALYNQVMTEQIDQFFNPDGTLISIPVKSAKKIAVLLHIAQDLSPTTKYPEEEINAIITKYHDDTAAIRRHMIEYGILERDGGVFIGYLGTLIQNANVSIKNNC